MALQSSPSSSYRFGTHDVFLSFRGSDTRFGFTGHLYKALDRKGIRTFIDDRELKRGEEITPSLVKAIKDSRIFIPVFSINYASSTFCLDELVRIIHCFMEKGRLVIPVFYGVDPSQVRHQTESYGEAIAKHEEKFKKNVEKYTDNMERLQKWKMALNKAANLCGHHVNNGNEYEYEFIEKIVKEVSNKLNRAPLYIADYPVGLESRLQELNSLLNVASHDGVCMIGIYGIGGIGKSTLARAAYNLIANQFHGLCFLHDVRENSARHGLPHLQEKLLFETIGLNIKFEHVCEGIPIIKEMLQQKKVLLILDDVDNLKQLQVLVGEPHWLGPGSRVIITTRDKQLLASHGIKRTYEVVELNKEEALELLRMKAFKNNTVDASYTSVLNRAIAYASGLPLALEVVGSNLFGKDIEEWKSTLDRYERIPNKEIHKILKVSFDALEKDEQDVFLDIACCFKGYKLEEVERILCAHYGHCVKYHLRVLVEKSLVKIYWSGVTLHDLIEDMGKEIVCQESPKELGKRSRLWFHENVVEVLEENKGTSQIEIIYLDFPLSKEEVVVQWKGDELKEMKNLKTLIIKNGRFSKGPGHLPNSLRVLEWHRYPSPNIPSGFLGKKLSICKLDESCLTSWELLDSSKKFVNMKELNLNSCRYLTWLPDISGFPNLEILSFKDCKNLIEVHDSIGFLDKLKILDAERCSQLKSFPPMKLTSLQKLKLSYCTSLESFPEILGEMKNITQIRLARTSIEEFPFSFKNLTRLRVLRIRKSRMLRLSSNVLMMMPNLSRISAGGVEILPKQNDKPSSMVSSKVNALSLRKCNLSDEFFSIVPTWFANVTFLRLSENNFTIIPECISECRFLSTLILDDCKHLQEIRGIPPNLKHLSARGCKSLTSSCRNMLLNKELHEAGDTHFCLPGNERIPEWFDFKSTGPSISFWFRNHTPSIALFFSSKSMHSNWKYRALPSRVNLYSRGYKFPTAYRAFPSLHRIQPDHAYLFVLPKIKLENNYELYGALLQNEWIHAEVMFWKEELRKSFLTEIGIHVIKEKSRMEDIQFINPYYEKKRKLGEDHNSSESHFQPQLKKHRFVDLEILEAELVQQQHRLALLSLQ